jgi:hypothetical protein
LGISCISCDRDKALVFGAGLDYFALVFNGSDWLAVTGRDKSATWLSAGAFCRERGWSQHRLLHELQHGLAYRTFPPGHIVDWLDPNVARSLDVERSEVTLPEEMPEGVTGLAARLVGFELLEPDAAADAEVPATAAGAPVPTPAPSKKVSDADLRRALLDFVEKHPIGEPPPGEEELHQKLEEQLGAPIERDRFRQALKDNAPQFKLSVGRPRKSAQ